MTAGSLPELLQRRAAEQGAEPAYVFLGERGEEVASLSYGQLHHQALAVAAELADRCRLGDRALLLFPHCLDFVAAYFGCLYAQVVAVPVSPPRGTRVADATRAVVADCEPAAVLTVAALRETIHAALAQVCGGAPWIAVDRLPPAPPGLAPRPCPPDSLAFLQYTSGSTSDPKGVMVTHSNLVANQEMIKHAFGHDERSTVLGWAPFFHDQGLVGTVLQPLYLGTPGILMAPMTFLRRPLVWLAAIARHRAHTSGGPNFAFDACVARAARDGVPDLDLSCWQVAYNGAEPVRPETLRAFAATFAPCGLRAEALYPCYGLAEATLLVTGSRKGRGPRTVRADEAELGRRRYRPTAGAGRTLAGSGLGLPGQDLRVVDPDTGRECGVGQVGEIWVAGPHVTGGYWRRPVETAATFAAELAGARYLRTGDLGVLVDGELYVVGRLKDVVIIRGRNYYPHDIENTVQAAHPAVALAPGAAFSVPAAAGETLVVVQEVRQRTADAVDVAASIRAAVTREHGLALGDLVLTRPGRLQRTTSGKIRRATARQRYLGGGFDIWEDAGRGRRDCTEP